MAHDRPAEPMAARETGITRLVAAEVQWRAAIETAAAEAARLIDAARAGDADADATLEREIGELCARRTDDAEAALRARCAQLQTEASARAARYDGVGAARERALAATIVERWWASGVECAPAAVAGGAA